MVPASMIARIVNVNLKSEKAIENDRLIIG
jgi:hypothetical protein